METSKSTWMMQSMRQKEEIMNNQKFYHYICWGVTAFLVIAASIAFCFVLLKFKAIEEAFSMLLDILAPVIYGAVMAYLLSPVFNRCVLKTEPVFTKWTKNEKQGMALAKAVATLASLVVLAAIVVGLFSMLIPEVIKSIQTAVNSLPENMRNLSLWVSHTLENNPEAEQMAITALDRMYGWARGVLEPNLDKILGIIGNVSSGVISVLIWFKNILIGLIVMIYMLNIKDQFVALAKKITYGIFSVAWANRLIKETRFIHKVFGGFIIGKIVDSLIIGVLCFVCLSFMKMPYTLLVSVIVGVTNIIPFFGPFIGAVPSAFLILLVSPVQCLYFLIFILLLQQFDGNILGPKILGDSTGISSFWVLFSILLFGGLLGFAGMIIGVPAFAVIYRLVGNIINEQLRRKKLSVRTRDYKDLDYVEVQDKSYKKL